MKVQWKREPPSRAILEVEVPAEDVARGVREAATRLAQRVRVPGFRRGKVPRAILERYVGRDEVYGEAAEELVSSAYRRAVVEAGMIPVGRPEFEVPPLDEASPLRFVARVDVTPEVDPGPYGEVRVQRPAAEIGHADVDAALDELRRGRSQLKTSPDAAAAAGDFVLIRPTAVEGTDRFQVGREVLVELGSGSFPQEVEAVLEGARAGDEREAALGESGRVAATIVDVRRRELPALDDAFAKAVGKVNTVDELRARVREQLSGGAARRAQDEHEEQVLEAVLNGATVELPASLIEHEIEHLLADLADSLQRRGYSLERYLESAGKDLPGLREELRPRAERRLRSRLVLDEIARRENLAPSQEEIAVEEEKVASELKQDPSRVREWLAEEGRRDAMIATLRRRKTIASLVSRAQGSPGG